MSEIFNLKNKLSRFFNEIKKQVLIIYLSYETETSHLYSETERKQKNLILIGEEKKGFLTEVNRIIKKYQYVPRIDPIKDSLEWSQRQYDEHKKQLEEIFNEIQNLTEKYYEKSSMIDLEIPKISIVARNENPDIWSVEIKSNNFNEEWVTEYNPKHYTYGEEGLNYDTFRNRELRGKDECRG